MKKRIFEGGGGNVQGGDRGTTKLQNSRASHLDV